MVIVLDVLPAWDPKDSIFLTRSMPSTTSPADTKLGPMHGNTPTFRHTEHDVSAVEPRGNDSGNEELRAIGVLSSVSHGEQTRLFVLLLEVLIY